MTNQEEFRPIITEKEDYTGLYEVSNHGKVKSLKREVNNQYGSERILKPGISRSGYYIVSLHKNGKQKTPTIHSMEWDAFSDVKRNGKKLQIDHKDSNKLNNMFDNLQLLSARQNVSKRFIQNGNKTSKYTGVYWDKKRQKWHAQITINGKKKHLGFFTTEYEAHLDYQRALGELNESN